MKNAPAQTESLALPRPLVSIVTITFNDREGLARTLRSVDCQTLQDREFIVVDGASTDGSLELIKECEGQIDLWISEPDEGIADAFNKGVKLSRGRYIVFMNSGDCFYSEDALAELEGELKKGPDLLMGRAELLDDRGEHIQFAGSSGPLRRQLYRNHFLHQSMLIQRELFDRIGPYRKDLRVEMDYEWSLRLLKEDRPLDIQYSSVIVSKMLMGGVSNKNFVRCFLAFHRCRQEHRLLPFSFSLCVSLFYILRRAVGQSLRQIKKAWLK